MHVWLFKKAYWIRYFEVLKLFLTLDLEKSVYLLVYLWASSSIHSKFIACLSCLRHDKALIIHWKNIKIVLAIMEHLSHLTIWGIKFLNLKMGLFPLSRLLWRLNLEDNMKGPAFCLHILGEQWFCSFKRRFQNICSF